MSRLLQRLNWKHCLTLLRETQRLNSSAIIEGVHHTNKCTISKLQNNVYSVQRNVQTERYCHRFTTNGKACLSKKHYNCSLPCSKYNTLSSIHIKSKLVRFLSPNTNNCGINVRSCCNQGSDSKGTSEGDDRVLDQNQGTNPVDDISSHPEVKEILKEMMKDFDHEVKSVTDNAEEDVDSKMLSTNVDEAGSLSSESSGSDDSSGSSSSDDESDLSSSDSDAEVSDNLVKALQVEEWDVIDMDKEMSKYNIEEFYGIEYTEEVEEDETLPSREELLPIALNRGQTGVFDVEDIVAVLKEDNMSDICVISIPKDIQFVDYMVLATGKSIRQLKATAENIQWIWKRKRGKKDPASVKVEGLLSRNWLALDMGNIALHLFLPEVRAEYDLETLWACGPEFDEQNATRQETYSIPVSTGLSLEESRQVLISNIDRQIRMKKQGQGRKTGEGQNFDDSDIKKVDTTKEGLGGSQDGEGFVMSKDLFDNDTPSKRIQRKYMVKPRDDAEESGFENTAGYHPKYDGSESK